MRLLPQLRNGVGADPFASGACRVCGSINYKAAYRPLFPVVNLVCAQPGRIVAPDEIAPFLAPEEQTKWVELIATSRARRWPDYSRELLKAPQNHAGTAPDRSVADIRWAMIALTWGFDPHQTAAQLLQVSEKAKEAGERYARRTVDAALKAVGRGRPTRD